MIFYNMHQRVIFPSTFGTTELLEELWLEIFMLI